MSLCLGVCGHEVHNNSGWRVLHLILWVLLYASYPCCTPGGQYSSQTSYCMHVHQSAIGQCHGGWCLHAAERRLSPLHVSEQHQVMMGTGKLTP